MAEKKFNPNAGHRERMRQRYLESGLKNFQPHEIIEMLLFNVLPRRDTNKLAHELIQKFGSVANVLDADIDELCQIDGISTSSAIYLTMLPEVFRAYRLSSVSVGADLSNKKECSEYLNSLYIGEKLEKIYLLCVDSMARVVSTTLIGEGSPDMSLISTHKIVETAIRNKCTRVVLVHNHPAGDPAPSDSDVFTTNSLRKRLMGISITLEDHFIVGNYVLSLRELGYLNV